MMFQMQFPNDTLPFDVFWRRGVYEVTGFLQIFYVSIAAIVIIVDAVGKCNNHIFISYYSLHLGKK